MTAFAFLPATSRWFVHLGAVAMAFSVLPALAASPAAICEPTSLGDKACVLDFGPVQVKSRDISADNTQAYDFEYRSFLGGRGGVIDLEKVSVSPVGTGFSLDPNIDESHVDSGNFQYFISGFDIHSLGFEAASGYLLNSVTATVTGTVDIVDAASLRLWGSVSGQQFVFTGESGKSTTFAFSFTGEIPAHLEDHQNPLSINWEGFVGNPDLGGAPLDSALTIHVDQVSFKVSTTAVPEPEQGVLVLGGLLALAGIRCRARGSKMPG